jgi:hypothetical protein
MFSPAVCSLWEAERRFPSSRPQSLLLHSGIPDAYHGDGAKMTIEWVLFNTSDPHPFYNFHC